MFCLLALGTAAATKILNKIKGNTREIQIESHRTSQPQPQPQPQRANPEAAPFVLGDGFDAKRVVAPLALAPCIGTLNRWLIS